MNGELYLLVYCINKKPSMKKDFSKSKPTFPGQIIKKNNRTTVLTCSIPTSLLDDNAVTYLDYSRTDEVK